MKLSAILSILCLFLISCQSQEVPKSTPKTWIGLTVDESQMVARKDSFNMYRGDLEKIGSMVWVMSNEGDTYQMKDFSKFDDGTIDEHATFKMDKRSMNTSEVELSLKMTNASIDLLYTADSSRIEGEFILTQGGNERVTSVDSVFNMDVFRNEIYMMLHTVELKEGAIIPLSVFVNTSGAITEASIEVMGIEPITTTLGTFEATKLFLSGGGGMPDNTIWIKNEFPRRIVRVEVTGQGLGLELVSTTGKL